VGHGGTLDPLASGVLPICLGEATKLAQFLLDADKEYQATIGFGVETDTYDAAGKVVATRDAGHLSEAQVRAALARFVGEQQQIPPMFSALKRDGRPLYARARAGEVVERAARSVNIMTLELEAFTVGQATITLRCSKGTYVRSLAHDLGQALGTGAHLTALRRIRSGPFTLAQAIAPDALGIRPLPLVPAAAALAHLPSIAVSDEQARTIAEGRRLLWSEITPAGANSAIQENARVRILTTAGDLLAVAPVGAPGDLVRTVRVFRGATRGTAHASVESNAP
jgi:tRNA pseudouridine55 synthase